MWPWPWRYQTNLFARNSGPWWWSTWKFNEILVLFCELDLEHNHINLFLSFFLLSQNNPAFDDKPSNQSLVAKGSVVQKYGILIMWAFTVILTLMTSQQPFRMKLWLLTMHHNTKLVINDLAVQKISSGQTFIYNLNHCCDPDLEQSNPFFF